jgi:membrane dipeptidase
MLKGLAFNPMRIHMKLLIGFLAALSGTAALQGQTRHGKRPMIADTHNDVVSQVMLLGKNVETDLTGRTHTDVTRLTASGLGVQVFSIFCDESYGQGTAFKMAIRQIDSLNALVSRHSNQLALAQSANDIAQAAKAQKLACMLGVEGGHMIENRMDYLDSLYSRGARYMTLTWNNSTPWATSAKDETEGNLPAPYLRRGFAMADRGLDSMGRAVVQRMQQLGMMVDISHVGEATFKDVLAMATKPVIASHSSVYAICPHRRNLKDYQIKAIAKNKGFIGVNFYSGFLDSSYSKRQLAFQLAHKAEKDSLLALGKKDYQVDDWFAQRYGAVWQALRPPLSVLIDHIDYIVKLTGPKYVGLGSDFDGIESAPQQLNGVESFSVIATGLKARGYSAKNIKRIMGGNFMRVLRANER